MSCQTSSKEARKQGSKEASKQAKKRKETWGESEGGGKERSRGRTQREREREVSTFSYVIFDSSGPACMSFFSLLFPSPVCTACMYVCRPAMPGYWFE
jgi:hypothetical protein